MIVSHLHGFVFIKTRKTAGSSAEIAISRSCGPHDVVTPLSDDLGEEALRAEEGGNGPLNAHKTIREHRGFREWKRLLLRGRRATRPVHMEAQEIRRWLGSALWQRYSKFTIERNPWDRALSRYHWQKYRWEKKPRSRPFPPLSEYLQWLETNKPHWLSNWDHYAIDGRIAVDRVLRYERLAQELEAMRERLGIRDASWQLPGKRAKGGFRGDARPYTEVLSDADRALIERVCHREIAALGYRFDEPEGAS